MVFSPTRLEVRLLQRISLGFQESPKSTIPFTPVATALKALLERNRALVKQELQVLCLVAFILIRTSCYDPVPDRSQDYACKRSLGTAQRNLGLDLTEQRTSHVTLIILITVTIVRISLVYRKTRSLLCSCFQLIVHSDCLVYNNTKPLLQYFITATCPLHRVPTRPLSHLTSTHVTVVT